MSEWPEVIIDIGDPTKTGLYRSFAGTVRGKLGIAVRGNALPSKYRLVRRSSTAERPWDDVNVTDARIEIAIGEPDQAPSSGVFSMAANLSTVGLTALAAGISAGNLQTALNANAEVIAKGGVTVEKFGAYGYAIYSNAINQALDLTADGSGLRPDGEATCEVITAAGANARQVVSLRVARKPYAYLDSFDESAAAAIVLNNSFAVGTASRPNIKTLTFGAIPYSGFYTLEFPKPCIYKVTAKANDATKDTLQVSTVADVAGSLDGKYFDVYDNTDDPVRIWLNLAGTSTHTPDAPAGGRLLSVTYASGANSGTIAAAINSKVNTDGFRASTVKASRVTLTATTFGPRTFATDSLDTGFTFSVISLGTWGSQDHKTFLVPDDTGLVAVWMDASGGAMPSEAANEYRAIRVVINPNDSATAVATATAAAIETDTKFSGVSSGSIIGIVDSVGGERDLVPDSSSSGWKTLIQQTGKSIQAVVKWSDTASQITSALSGYFVATQTSPGKIVLRCTSNGDQPAMSVDYGSLIFANNVEGAINLNTLGMFQAFAVSTEDTHLELVYEATITFPDQLPFTFYREVIKVYRSVLDPATLVSVPRPAGFWVTPPASHTSLGTPGQMAGDATYLYVCYATNQWGYAALNLNFPPP